MDNMARFAPRKRTIVLAIDSATPVISTTFPKIAPNKKTAKYDLINPTIFSINTPEKKGNTWIGAMSTTANNAHRGANKITE